MAKRSVTLIEKYRNRAGPRVPIGPIGNGQVRFAVAVEIGHDDRDSIRHPRTIGHGIQERPIALVNKDGNGTWTTGVIGAVLVSNNQIRMTVPC